MPLLLSIIKPGDILYPDNDFTCMKANKPRRVYCDRAKQSQGASPTSCLYIRCRSGRHYLDGQENTAGELIGLSATPWENL